MQEQYTAKRTLRAIVAGLAVAAIAVGCVPDEGAEREPRQDVSSKADKLPQQGGKPQRDDKPEPRLETASEANARTTAESYLDSQAFSREGLIDQLKFEGYSDKAATYGAGAAGADWNEQAALSAESYLDSQSFSRAGLIDQLKFEGFTQAQAEHGVSVAYR